MALPPPFSRTAGPDDERRARSRLAALMSWPAHEQAPGQPEDPSTTSDVTNDQTATAGARLRVDRQAAALLAVLALVGVLLGGWLLWRARPVSADLGPAGVPPPTVPPVATAPAVPEIVVDVQGDVRRPGVVRLPAGSRVMDALAAAGGPRSGVPTVGVNLARVLADGEQVVLAAPGSVPVAAPAAPGQPGSPATGPVDLNAATPADLDTLPGVGPVMAQRIIEWRTAHGRFSSVDELQEVPGIGPAKYESLRPRVRVG